MTQTIEQLSTAGGPMAQTSSEYYAKEIEQLQARVAELEAENARLNERWEKESVEADRWSDKWAETTNQLLTQVDNKRLRDALTAARRCLAYSRDKEFNRRTIAACDEALANQHDTSALDAFVAEKVKESHKVVPRDGLVPHAYQLEATHNNAEFWYRAGHSEEARAKGESVICMAQAVFAWRNAAYAKAEEVSELTRQRDLAVEALDVALENLRPHGDNCFVSNNYEGDPGAGCNCGIDGVTDYLIQTLSTIKESEGK